jgi:dTDP-glucose pyrophosphorylase
MIVIPMAGESRRFRDAGYEHPKYMLPVSGRPVFDWVLLSFHAYFKTEPFLFIARDMQGTAAFLRERISKLGIKNAQIALLDKPTAGQAETVEAGLVEARTSGETEVIIFNIDTIRPHIDIGRIAGTQGWLEVFTTPGENWSFIELDPRDSRRVVHCAEKQRVSDLCCTGLYAFSNVGLFFESLEQERANPTKHELFVAPLYNHLIADGYEISWRQAPRQNVILSGVPAEYELLKKNGLDFEDFAS